MNRVWLIGIGFGLVAWSTPAFAELGRAEIRGTSTGSTVSGTAWVFRTLAHSQTSPMVRIEVSLSGTPPGQHGIHIHEFGDCSDGGKGAGGHYNPDDAPHGYFPQDGLAQAHVGDLGNIEIDQDGMGELVVILQSVDLTHGKYNLAGRALVLHEKADDFSQPTGNAGGRIGCGPILITPHAAHPHHHDGADTP